MPIPPPPPGWTRFLVKSKFAAGRDFSVLDPETEGQIFFVDGKMGTRPKADIRDAADQVVYQVTGKLLGVPKKMVITNAAEEEVATLTAKMFSPIKSHMTLTMNDGGEWELDGSLLEKNYTIRAAGEPVVEITQKWVTIRDAYTLDVIEGADPALALAVLWAVDRWTERD